MFFETGQEKVRYLFNPIIKQLNNQSQETLQIISSLLVQKDSSCIDFLYQKTLKYLVSFQ